MNYDQDLQSIQQARTLCSEAKDALEKMKSFTQKDVDRIVAGMVEAGAKAARRLAELAVEETGFGVAADKAVKNELATRRVYEYIRDMKTVGVIRDIRNDKIVEIAEPVGVIAGLIPVTNPTSTTLFKAIIALKAKNTIVFSPHPNAVQCTKATVDVLQKAIEPLGAPRNAISVITLPTMKATEELMTNPNIAVILATGGSAMVKSAYSSGKPAFGVGPGNVPAFIERSADVRKAVADIIASKTFDNGTVCASEQSIIVDRPISAEVKQALKDGRAYVMNGKESALVAKVLVDSRLTINPKLVGQTAHFITQQAGFQTPNDTTLLVAELAGVGKEFPLSVEKLSPVIAYYEVDGWEQGCQRCVELLKFGGMGHTLAIHSNNRDVIMEFALKKPAYRIVVNTPSTHGAVGYTTNLPPSLTLGCGTHGGNITSDNISPLHLINIKRLAFETRPLSQERAASQSVLSGEQKKLITEKDVRQAIARGEKIKLGKDSIVTPLARDMGRAHHVFE